MIFCHGKSWTKLFLIMKLTVILLLISVAQLFAREVYSQEAKVSLKVDNSAIGDVLSKIEKQTSYLFFYKKNEIDVDKKVSINATDQKVSEVLNTIFTGDVKYNMVSDYIVLTKNSSTPDPATQQVKRTIKGTIRDGATGELLPGVSVVIEGTSTGVVSDVNGVYVIQVQNEKAVLVFSYMGYTAQKVPVAGTSVFDIKLSADVKQLNEVVVTALGIKKEVRSLSYNVQKIESVTSVNGGSVVNSLIGKIAGATVNTSSAGDGSSARIVMRGVKSISGNNNALYVIDGIPMTNSIRGQAEDVFSGAGQTGDFVENINPDDVESISILSGPSAAALYGSAAANGVVMINTKKGSIDKTNISVSQTTTVSNPLLLPKFQNTYGTSGIGSYYSWGDKLVTPSTYNPADFFQSGLNSNTSVTLSTGTQKNQTYVSIGNVTSKGIIPNNDNNRYTFNARNSAVFLDGKLNLDLGFMAGLVNEQNMISQGQYFNPLVPVYLFPPGDDFNKVKSFERYSPARNLMTQYWNYGDNGLMMQNPYWITQRDLFPNTKEHYMATMSVKYNIADWIYISGKAKLDKENEKDQKMFAGSTNLLFASDDGYYSLNTLDTRQIYGEGLVNINKTFKNVYSITANVGTSIEDVNNNQYMYGGKLQGVANLYTFANVNKSTSENSQSGYEKQKQSVFGSAQLGYKNMAFLDMTARNDWASSLAGSGHQSFFYPSIGLSGVVTDLLKMKSDILPYLKVRGSYSAVGNEPDVFLTNPTYPLSSGYPVTQTRMPNPNLQPELTKSWEAGISASLFKGALKVEATVYTSSTYNQFFQPTLSSASGYTSVIVNAGRIDNKGIEASVSYNTNIGSLNWTSYSTFSLNRNKIIQLLPGWTNPVTGEVVSLHEMDMSGTGSYKMVLKEGGSMGDIYVNTLNTDEHGAIYVDPGSQTVVATPNKFVFAGNNNPSFTLNWGNEFKWKNLNLSFLFAGRFGGIVVSNTQAIMDAFGVSQASADARDAGGALVNGRPVPAKDYYSIVGAGASGGIASMYVYDATNVRLSELSLGYDIPVHKLFKSVKSASISVIGRNLLLLYCKAPFDPELTANTQTYFQGIDYFMMPSLRSVGFSVKLNF